MNHNNLYQANLSAPTSKRNLVNSQVTNARLNCNKAHKTINVANMIERVELEMFNISFKANRSESQRNERSIKRQQR